MRSKLFLDYVPEYSIENGYGRVSFRDGTELYMPLHILRVGAEMCRQVIAEHDAEQRPSNIIPITGTAG